MWCSPGFSFEAIHLYTPVSSVNNSHYLSHHLYADDTHVSISLSIPYMLIAPCRNVEIVLMTFFIGRIRVD